MSVAHEVSSIGWKMTSATPIATEDHISDGQCWRNHCPSLLEVQESHLFPEQSRAPLRILTGDSSLNSHACLLKCSLKTPYIPAIVFGIPHSSPFDGGVQWLPRRKSASMSTRKNRCSRRRRRSDGHLAMTMTHRRRRSLLRRNPPTEPALTMVTPPTQRTTTTMATTTGVSTTTTTAATMMMTMTTTTGATTTMPSIS
jgi:hypothetical protein